jgi:hypothetical protein
MMPEIETSQNGKLTRVDIGEDTYWFSYTTCVAFRIGHDERIVVHENIWSDTTGRHLNEIDGGTPDARARRVPAELFEQLHKEAIHA